MNGRRWLALALALGALGAGSADRQLAVRGGRVHTMTGPPIDDGVVLVREGRIVQVGPSSRVAIPRDAETLRAAVVTPGLIDGHSVVGLSGYLNQRQDQDQLDRTEAIQPELRAIDAYDSREKLVDWVRRFGVTTIHTGHAPGMLISGQTMIAKTRGATVEDAVIVPEAMVAVTLGQGAVLPETEKKPPGTRSKAVALLRAELARAQEYKRKRELPQDKRPDRDLGLEVLVRVLDGKLPLLVTAQRHQDIRSALRIAEEFNIQVVLDGAAEAYLLLDEIKRAGAPVILHATMARAVAETENLSMETAAKLAQAGIPFALQSGYESYVPKTRVALFEAAIAAAYGLGPERALAAITIDAARLLHIDKRVGSLEPGKDADLALYDGDPFEYTTHCVGVIIDGESLPGEKP